MSYQSTYNLNWLKPSFQFAAAPIAIEADDIIQYRFNGEFMVCDEIIRRGEVVYQATDSDRPQASQ